MAETGRGQAHEVAAVKPHRTLTEYYATDEQRPGFVRRLFDQTAPSYDAIERMIGLGTGPLYRREALRRSGLGPGMVMLDVAIGTGLVAREAVRVIGEPKSVVGLDPSPGMLGEARRAIGVNGLLGVGERLPCRDAAFDFLSMGYALRHLSDLGAAFSEFHRVLGPGGRVCILELTRPRNRAGYYAIRFYLRRIVPLLTRLTTRNSDAELLMRYFWDTIENCVPPADILSALAAAGFEDVRRVLVLGLFSEYTGRKAGTPRVAPPAREPDGDNFFNRKMEG